MLLEEDINRRVRGTNHPGMPHEAPEGPRPRPKHRKVETSTPAPYRPFRDAYAVLEAYCAAIARRDHARAREELNILCRLKDGG